MSILHCHSIYTTETYMEDGSILLRPAPLGVGLLMLPWVDLRVTVQKCCRKFLRACLHTLQHATVTHLPPSKLADLRHRFVLGTHPTCLRTSRQKMAADGLS